MASDRWGVPVLSDGEAGVDVLDAAVEDFVSLQGDPVAKTKEAARADPSLVLAGVLRAYFHLYATTPGRAAAALACLDALPEGDDLPGRERLHLGAARLWAAGELEEAARSLEDALRLHPRDLLALKIAQDLYFFLGNRLDLRDVATRVLPAWPAGSEGAGFVRGMLAFGLVENDAHAAAFRSALEALDANPADVWAVHAGAHVLEMEGRQDEGIAFLRGRVPDWEDSYFAVHNWWHLALYHIELGQLAEALSLYDSAVRAERTDVWLDLIDAASLLWRLHLEGVDLGLRPAELAADMASHAGEAVSVFNSLHLVMVAGLAGRGELAEAAAEATRTRSIGTNRRVAEAVGNDLLAAFSAFSAGAYERTGTLLFGARPNAAMMGGSNAQRDVVDLTLLASAARDENPALVAALVAERDHRKPAAAAATARLAGLAG